MNYSHFLISILSPFFSRFISHLPVGSELGIVTFDSSSSARVNTEPTIVKVSNKEGLYGRIPYRLSSDLEGCVDCGMDTALKIVNNEQVRRGGAGSAILLVTSSGNRGSRKLTALERRVKKLAVPVYTVLFQDSSVESNVDFSDLRHLTSYGQQFIVSSKYNMLQRLSSVFLTVLDRVGGPKVVESYQKYSAWNGRRTSGTFRIDDVVKNNLWIVLTSPFKEDVESFEVTSPSGQKYVFPKYDHGIVYFYLEGPNEPGIWSYNTMLHHTVHNGAMISIQVFGEHSSMIHHSSTGIQFRTWTNLGVNGSTSPMEQPVIIYVEVSQDHLPVNNALVEVTVTKPGGRQQQEQQRVVEIRLKDSGSGYPDITKGDGVYSGYLTDYSAEGGFYSYHVRVTSNDGKATISKPYGGASTDYECCGSELPEYFTSIPTQSFERYLTGPSFYSAQGVQYVIKNGAPQMKDIFPPSRVSDLRVVGYINSTLYASLSWTSPGGDLDQGRAASYELRSFLSKDSLTDSNFLSSGIPVNENFLPDPLPSGTEQTCRVNLPMANEVFYYALVSVDESGNRSPISNLVSAKAIEVTTTTIMEMSFKVVNDSSTMILNGLLLKDDSRSSSSSSGDMIDRETMVFIIAGAISAFVFIISVIFFAAVCRAKHNSARENSSKAAAAKELRISPPYLIQGGGGSSSVTSTSTLPDLAPEKSPYDVWKINHSSGTNQDDYAHMYITGRNVPVSGSVRGLAGSSSGPTSWPYHHHSLQQVMNVGGGSGLGPVSLTPSMLAQTAAAASHSLSVQQQQQQQQQAVVGLPLQDFINNSSSEMASSSNSPTYQNWGNSNNAKNSDSGTTASTDCSDSDQNSDKNVYNVPSSTLVTRESGNGSTGGAGSKSGGSSSKRGSKRNSSKNNGSGACLSSLTLEQSSSSNSSQQTKLSSHSMLSAVSLSNIERKKRQESLV